MEYISKLVRSRLTNPLGAFADKVSTLEGIGHVASDIARYRVGGAELVEKRSVEHLLLVRVQRLVAVLPSERPSCIRVRRLIEVDFPLVRKFLVAFEHPVQSILPMFSSNE